MKIDHETEGRRGRFHTRVRLGPVAELRYSLAGERLMQIEHTTVPDVYRGEGVGLALMECAVETARAAGRKILPLCPFAAAQFRRHPEWNDVLTRAHAMGRVG